MAAAAERFLDGLSLERRAKAAFAFQSAERGDWHIVPGVHHGLAFADMTDADRLAARELVRTALSARGTLKVEAIIALESVLKDLENGSSVRDPLKYSVAIFGAPGKEAPWAWHFEGHHISLNFTCAKGEVISVTPYFLGANPGEVRAGANSGKRALAGEEDLGRELVTSLSAEQRGKAIIAEAAPKDVLTLPGRPIGGLWPEPSLGLPVAELTAEQRGIFDELLDEYLRDLRGPLAAAELERMRGAGLDKIRFCWAGGLVKGEAHYYRLVGPTFVIEYDNTQNDANHIHTVWHDRMRDFGGDALAEHLKGDGK